MTSRRLVFAAADETSSRAWTTLTEGVSRSVSSGSERIPLLVGLAEALQTVLRRTTISLWNGTVADGTVTPSCMSCHKGHGNANPFGLIFMTGSGANVTENGDGGVYKDLCRQCHVQGG